MNSNRWTTCLIALFFCLAGRAAAVEGRPSAELPLTAQNFELQARYESGLPLDPEKISFQTGEAQLRLEGRWGSPESEGGIPDLILTVPIRLHYDLALVRSRSALRLKEIPGRRADIHRNYILELPLTAGDENGFTLQFVSKRGHVKPVRLQAVLKLPGVRAITNQACKDLGITVRPAGKAELAKVFLMNCASEGSEVRVAVRPMMGNRFTGYPGDCKLLDRGQTLTLKMGLRRDGRDWTDLQFRLAGLKLTDLVPYVVVRSGDAAARWFGHFQLGPLAGLQSSGGSSFSFLLSWYPTLRLSPNFSLMGELSFSVLKGLDASIPTAQYGVLASVGPWAGVTLEAGPGFQTWFGYGGTFPVIEIQLARRLNRRWAGWVDRVFAGYGAFFFRDDFTHQFKFGAGIAF